MTAVAEREEGFIPDHLIPDGTPPEEDHAEWTLDAPDALIVFFHIYDMARGVAYFACKRKGKCMQQAAPILKYYMARCDAKFKSFAPTEWQRAHPH